MNQMKNIEIEAGVIDNLLDRVWKEVTSSKSSWNPDKSCEQLYEEYAKSGRTPAECAENFINWQTTKAGAVGFVSGLPGLTFAAITIPADLTATVYLQLRMVAVIALLYGWDLRSDRLKTTAFLCLLGSSAAEAISAAGVKVGTKLTANLIKQIPGHALIAINKAVGFRLITKAGTTGVVNLTKLVPIVGGLVSGGLNAVATRQIGQFAESIFKAGPDYEAHADA
jgi:hypothetical protein